MAMKFALQVLKRRRCALAIAPVLALLSLAARPGSAQEVQPIVPANVGSVSAVTPSAGGMVASVGAPTSAAAGAPVQTEAASAAAVGALIEQFRAHTLTPEEAWKKGALDLDDLLYIVNERFDTWGGFNWHGDVPLRRSIVKLLVEHGGERLKDISKLPLKVRLWLADYYSSIGDERTVALAESVLAEFKPGVVEQEDLAFQAVERISWFRRHRSQYEESAQKWLWASVTFDKNNWKAWDARWSAALDFQNEGKNVQASALFKEVIASEQPTFSGLAALCATYREDGHMSDDAVQVLTQVASLRKQEPVGVVVLARLGLLQASGGKKKEALETFERGVELSRTIDFALVPPSLSSNIRSAASMCSSYVALSKGGILGASYPRALTISVIKGKEDELTDRIFIIKSPHPVDVDWGTLPAGLTITTTGREWSGDVEGDGDCREYLVCLKPGFFLLGQAEKTVLLKGHGQLGGSIEIPITIHLQSAVG